MAHDRSVSAGVEKDAKDSKEASIKDKPKVSSSSNSNGGTERDGSSSSSGSSSTTTSSSSGSGRSANDRRRGDGGTGGGSGAGNSRKSVSRSHSKSPRTNSKAPKEVSRSKERNRDRNERERNDRERNARERNGRERVCRSKTRSRSKEKNRSRRIANNRAGGVGMDDSTAAKRERSKERCLERSPVAKRRSRSGTPKPTRIHVGQLTRNVTKQHVAEIFSSFGDVIYVDFPMARYHPTFGRGIAYVEYATAEECESAMRQMDGGQIDGQEITVSLVKTPKLMRHTGARWRSRGRRGSPRPPSWSPFRRRRRSNSSDSLR